MKGRIISARMIPAVSMPIPIGGPRNSGRKPRLLPRAGSTCLAMNGAKTKSPHIPKMMLGTAASSSMAVPVTRRSVGGASSTRNRAITRLSGTAMTIAIAVETSVP